MTRIFVSLFAAAVAHRRCAGAASAMKIEKIVSPSGIEAWLVREQAVPLVALNYAFHGGSSQDTADKAGIANLPPACSTKAPATSTARPFTSGWKAAPSN